jgi:hypothetical protein
MAVMACEQVCQVPVIDTVADDIDGSEMAGTCHRCQRER